MKIISIMIGFFVGCIITATTVWMIMPTMMLTEHLSPFSVSQTVEKISANAKAEAGLFQVFNLYTNRLKNMVEVI